MAHPFGYNTPVQTKSLKILAEKDNVRKTCLRYIYDIYIPKTKKFDCLGRGDLTFLFLFKSCEIDRSQGRLP